MISAIVEIRNANLSNYKVTPFNQFSHCRSQNAKKIKIQLKAPIKLRTLT